MVEMLPHPRERKVLLGSWDPWSLVASESQTQAKMVDSETGAWFKSLLLLSSCSCHFLSSLLHCGKVCGILPGLMEVM